MDLLRFQELGNLGAWPNRLHELGERLGKAADAAYLAGLDRIEALAPRGGRITYHKDTPPDLRLVTLMRPTDYEGSAVGNLAWFAEEPPQTASGKYRGRPLFCCIASVIDLHDEGALWNPHHEKHARVAAAFGPVCLFPQRLRQLSERFLLAAARVGPGLRFTTLEETGGGA